MNHGVTEEQRLRDALLRSRAMLLRLYLVGYRSGWEEGESEEEIRQRVADYLSNVGLDPVLDKTQCAELLEEY
jgi:hypothetical protein